MEKKVLVLIIVVLFSISVGVVAIVLLNNSKNNSKEVYNNSDIENIDIENIEEITEETDIALKEDELRLKVNGKSLLVKLEHNSSVDALLEKLKDGDLELNAHDYGNFEKVADLTFSIPKNDEYITTEPGDLVLYQGNHITLYYDTNTWNLTRLGKVQNVSADELTKILGDGEVIFTLSIN